jgi:Na+/pantothenate symporter
MADFFAAWGFALMLGSPFVFLLLITILPISRSNPTYKIGWLNLLSFGVYSFFIVLIAYILDKEPGSGGLGFAALFTIIPLNVAHLLSFWLWLFFENRANKKTF